MNINRNNAEAFFLDYYEGNLSQEQVTELFAFLNANPDMREVFESFGDITVEDSSSLVPHSSPDVDFSFLKKEAAVDEHELAEQWMVELVDGVISPADKAKLDAYLQNFPAKRKELELLEKTILRADHHDSFGDSSSLKKSTAITAGNFDDYAIALIEGTISENDKQLFDAFIAAHPEFENQLELFRKSRLAADDSVQLADKSFLKKSVLVVNDENIMELLVAKMEGELPAHDEEAVDAYIAKFPELKLELELLERTRLKADESAVFEGKDKLKRGAVLINASNFEQYLLSATEGLLNSEELNAFNAFVAAHPKYRRAVAIVASARVQPDLTVVYENKEELKRKQKKGAPIWWTLNIRYAAAAIFVIVLGVYLWMKFAAAPDAIDHSIANNPHPSINNSNNNDVPELINPGNNTNATNDNLASNSTSDSNQPKWNPVNYQRITFDDADKKVEAVPVVIVENTDAPKSIVASHIPNKANDAVAYSDALYSALFDPQATTLQNSTDSDDDGQEYISPGQYAMRWAKNKLDGPEQDPELAQIEPGDQAGFAAQQPQDKNVDGLDLTQSAVNRVGVATGGNISMQQEADGTYLHLWSYSIRVSQAK